MLDVFQHPVPPDACVVIGECAISRAFSSVITSMTYRSSQKIDTRADGVKNGTEIEDSGGP